MILSAVGNHRWKERYIKLHDSKLSVAHSKKDEDRPKHIREMATETIRLVIPLFEENPSYFSFQLIPILDNNANKKVKGRKIKPDPPFHFRFEKVEDHKQWTKVIQARLMESSLLQRYRSFAQLSSSLPPSS